MNNTNPPFQNPGPVVLDCDTGRDDALAIWAALALGWDLAAVITSYGNVKLDRVTDNTARVLAFAGRDDVPLLPGATAPSRPHRGLDEVVLPRQASAGNGLCNLVLPPASRTLPAPLSPEALATQIKTLAGRHGRLHYMILGPATNFSALCSALGDALPDYIAGVTMMGGKDDALWAQNPVADFNLICDPFAVHHILARGIGLRFVSMATTWPIVLTLAEVEALRPRDGRAKTAQDLMIAHCRHFAPEPAFRFHDPAAVMALGLVGRFRPVRVSIDRDESSPSFGRLAVDKAGFDAALFDSDPACTQDFLNGILAALGLERS